MTHHGPVTYPQSLFFAKKDAPTFGMRGPYKKRRQKSGALPADPGDVNIKSVQGPRSKVQSRRIRQVLGGLTLDLGLWTLDWSSPCDNDLFKCRACLDLCAG